MKERYLIAYNVIQACGWAYVLVHATQHAWEFHQQPTRARGRAQLQSSPYDIVRDFVVTFQVASFAEVAHSMLGITRSPVGAALMQWCGRTHVLMCALDAVGALHGTVAATALVIAWALTEVVRYPSYALGLYSQCPSWLNWLRYTIFIPLYPLGAGAELKLMYDARAFARKANMYSFSMPNAFNFAFDYVTFLNGLLIVYPFLFYSLYSYMFTQRKKKLGHVTSVKKQQ